MLRLSDEQYRPYAVVYPETYELLNMMFESTTTRVFADSFLTELPEKHGVGNVVFLADGSHSLQDARHRYGFDFRYEGRGNRNSVKRVFRGIKRQAICFSNCFSNAEVETADDWARSFSFVWNRRIRT